MKRFALFATLATLAVSVFAVDANRLFYSAGLNPTAVELTGTAVDIATFKGNGTVVVTWGTAPAATYTGTVTVAHCTTIDGTYTTVTNLAGTVGAMTNYGVTTNEVDTFAVDFGALHKYMQVSVAHLSVSNNVAAVIVAPMKSQ